MNTTLIAETRSECPMEPVFTQPILPPIETNLHIHIIIHNIHCYKPRVQMHSSHEGEYIHIINVALTIEA